MTVCPRCGGVLDADPGLSRRLNRVRGWLWRQAHRLNCPGSLVVPCPVQGCEHSPDAAVACVPVVLAAHLRAEHEAF